MILTIEVSHVNLDMEETILAINFLVYLEMSIFEKRNVVTFAFIRAFSKTNQDKIMAFIFALEFAKDDVSSK